MRKLFAKAQDPISCETHALGAVAALGGGLLYLLRGVWTDAAIPAVAAALCFCLSMALLFRCRPSCPEIACHDRPSKDFPILKLFSTNRRLLGRAEPKATDHIGARGGLPWFIQMIEPQTYIAQKGGVESAPADCAGL